MISCACKRVRMCVCVCVHVSVYVHDAHVTGIICHVRVNVSVCVQYVCSMCVYVSVCVCISVCSRFISNP